MNLQDRLSDLNFEIGHFNETYSGMESGGSYYDIDRFANEITKTKNDLSFVHINARSLWPKLDEIQSEIIDLKMEFDLICFTETWLSGDNVNMTVWENYRFVHLERSNNRRGGGVGALVHNKFSDVVRLECSYSDQNIQVMCLEVSVKNMKYLLCIIYRPPEGNINECIVELEQMFFGIKTNAYKDIFICGDFNVNFLNQNDARVQSLQNIFSSYCLLPVITQPTLVTDHSATLVDNIFVPKPGNVISGNIVSDLSDHFPIFCVAKQALVGGGEHHDPVTFKCRVQNEFTLNLLYSRIANTNFDSVLNSHDINVAMSQFYDILYDIYDTFCPIELKHYLLKISRNPGLRELQCYY